MTSFFLCLYGNSLGFPLKTSSNQLYIGVKGGIVMSLVKNISQVSKWLTSKPASASDWDSIIFTPVSGLCGTGWNVTYTVLSYYNLKVLEESLHYLEFSDDRVVTSAADYIFNYLLPRIQRKLDDNTLILIDCRSYRHADYSRQWEACVISPREIDPLIYRLTEETKQFTIDYRHFLRFQDMKDVLV